MRPIGFKNLSSKNLPYDAEVEWIRSDGNAYLNIGKLIFDTSSYIEIKFKKNRSLEGMLGTGSIHKSPVFTHDWFGAITSEGKKRVVRNFDTTTDHVTSIDFSTNTFKIDGNIITPEDFDKFSPHQTDPDCYIFWCGSTNEGKWSGRIYYIKISTNSKTFDFIPVRFMNENGVSEGAMYDRISGRLFRNSGTGAFIIGLDKDSSVSGGQLDDKIHFVKDFTFNRYDEINYDPGFSYIEDFIRVNPLHSITWLGSDKNIQPTTGDRSRRVLLEYDLNKNIIDYWNVNTSNGIRSITTSANTSFVRWCIENGFEDETYLLDNTSGLYIVKDRTIL